MKRPVYVIIFIFVTILGLVIAQISVANQISTTGAKLAALQQEIEVYERENSILEEEVLEATSLTNITKKAEELGYIEVKNQVALTNNLPLARR